MKKTLLLVAWLLAGCAVGPDFVRPEGPEMKNYVQGDDPLMTPAAEQAIQQFAKGAPVDPEWWKLLNSPVLDKAVREALLNNPTLQSAQASLRQSQESLRAGYGIFFPQFDLQAGGARQLFSPAKIGSGAPASIFNLYTLSAAVSYPLDLFGGERRQIEALQANVDTRLYSAAAAYLALTGNLANTLIAYAGYADQMAATSDIVNLLKDELRITAIQAKAGTVPYSNVLTIQSQLASAEATLPVIRQKMIQSGDLLAVLSGRFPSEWSPPRITLADITLPPVVPVALPSELVRSRPDILTAEAQLHGASAGIGVATAALFPNITLNGNFGQNSTETSQLFEKSSNFWSLGANITQPLFHGGMLWFQRKAAIEGFEASKAVYRQTVLSAFEQVADLLRALESDAEALDAQDRSLDAAEQGLNLVKANYQAGLANYLQIITATDLYQQARIGVLQARAQRLQDTVALFVALGGGWQEGDPRIAGIKNAH